MTPCLTMPNDRTEAEVRAEGHTKTPWFPCQYNTGGETGADIDIEIRPGGWFIRLSPGYPFSQMAYPAEAEKEFSANVAFTMLAVNSYDAMRAALEIVKSTISLTDNTGTLTLAGRAVCHALELARGVKP